MPKKRLNLGIIGTGAVFRLMHLPVLNILSGKFKIISAFDNDKKVYINTQRLIRKNKYDSINFKNTPEEIFNDSTVDAVAIMTPISSHTRLTIKSLKAGKNVFLEKPAALTVKELDRMIRTQKNSGKIVQVGMVLRFSSFYEKLKSLIDSGKYGKVLWMNWIETRPFDPAQWRYNTAFNGDAIIDDKAIHHINLFNSLAGSSVKKVSAFAGQYILEKNKHKKLRAFNREVMLKGDSSDNLMAIFEYKNGVKANLTISYVSPHARESRWIIQLEKARVVVYPELFTDNSKFTPSAIYLFKDDSKLKAPWKIPNSFPPSKNSLYFYDENKKDPLHPGSIKQWMEFYNCVTNKQKPECRLELAREDLKVSEMIRKSLKK